MKHRDMVSSLVWIFLGGLFMAGSLEQGLMRRGVPGPGFLPFFSGLAMVLISLFVLTPTLGQRKKAENSETFFPGRDSVRKVLLALAALVAFGVAIEYAGFSITTFFFMFFIALIMDPKRWRASAVLALLTAVISYLLFVVLLEVQLPKGWLGF